MFPSLEAFFWGGLSAVSLPLGAWLGLRLQPGHVWTSSLMSFGAGALLAALTLELAASTLATAGFAPFGVGFLSGALLFMGLNHVVNGQGGFLRKTATLLSYLTKRKRRHTQELLERLSQVDILRALPADEVQAIIPYVRERSFAAGETVFEEGAQGDRLYLIDKGEAEVRRGGDSREGPTARLAPGATFGEMALLTGERRAATIRATTALETWAVDKADFDRLLATSPRLKSKVADLVEKRLGQLGGESDAEAAARSWAREAMENLGQGALTPTDLEVRKARSEHGGAPLSIWLGILLDGIPESLVIGASLLHGGVSMTLIAGVFLANFPEALSSAVGMQQQGMTPKKIMWMWTSLMILTALGAGIGRLTFGAFPPLLFSLMESLAAGAMLAMIAETMLPEAAEQGGPANGLMTVLGFLTAIFVSSLGGPGH